MKKNKKFSGRLRNTSKNFLMKITLIILIVASIITVQSCSDNLDTAKELKSEFSLEFLKEHKEKIAILFNQKKSLILLDGTLKNVNFDAERLQYLVNKKTLNGEEENELNYYLTEIGFQNTEDFIAFQLELEELGRFLVERTTITTLSREEIDETIAEYLGYSKSDNLNSKSSCNNPAYTSCEEDVSAALAGDLIECAVATAVTGLSSGGLGGLIVGGVCTANALYQATISSKACVKNHCPQQ